MDTGHSGMDLFAIGFLHARLILKYVGWTDLARVTLMKFTSIRNIIDIIKASWFLNFIFKHWISIIFFKKLSFCAIFTLCPKLCRMDTILFLIFWLYHWLNYIKGNPYLWYGIKIDRLGGFYYFNNWNKRKITNSMLYLCRMDNAPILLFIFEKNAIYFKIWLHVLLY